jgi:hypothetical protein
MCSVVLLPFLSWHLSSQEFKKYAVTMEPTNKVVPLLEKCAGQQRYEVRLRAISSLLFKLQHDLIDEVPLKTQPFFLRNIMKSLLAIISSIATYTAETLKTEELFVMDVLNVGDHFAGYPTVKSVAAEELSAILNKLYYITTIENIGMSIRQRIEKVIQAKVYSNPLNSIF